MHRSRSFDLTVANRIHQTENKKVQLRASVGDDLQDLAKDRAIVTDPEETRRRRTIRLIRQHLRASWGFTLQTYGIRNKRTREVEVMSYVDYVEINGPAWIAGMKKGDVILSVNGESVAACTHSDLVTKIQRGGRELRLVVLFEDCCKKVELQERYIKLKKLLNMKLKELKRLEGEESRLLKGGGAHDSFSTNGEREILVSTPTLLSRLSALRQSGLSHTSIQSSASSEWETLSQITSPLSLDNLPVNQFAFDSSLSDVSTPSSRGSGSAHEASISGSTGSGGSQSDNQFDVSSSKNEVGSLEISLTSTDEAQGSQNCGNTESGINKSAESLNISDDVCTPNRKRETKIGDAVDLKKEGVIDRGKRVKEEICDDEPRKASMKDVDVVVRADSSNRAEKFKKFGLMRKSSSLDGESDLDSSGAFSRGGDWDTDSQTSFLSLNDSVSPRISTLSDILTRDDSSRVPQGPVSDCEENFRQMYTVARWVGVVGHHQGYSPSGYSCNVPFSRLKRLSSGSLDDPREVMRVRSLSSVHEVHEEVFSPDENEKIKVALNSRREECSGIDKKQKYASAGRLTTSHDNFYLESDSEDSSIVNGGDGNRGRRDTVINTHKLQQSRGSDSSTDDCRSGEDFIEYERSSINTGEGEANAPEKIHKDKSNGSNFTADNEIPSIKISNSACNDIHIKLPNSSEEESSDQLDKSADSDNTVVPDRASDTTNITEEVTRQVSEMTDRASNTTNITEEVTRQVSEMTLCDSSAKQSLNISPTCARNQAELENEDSERLDYTGRGIRGDSDTETVNDCSSVDGSILVNDETFITRL